MKVTVKRSRHNKKDWTVEIQQGVQYFRLDYSASRSDAVWMARMFRKALRAHEKEKLCRK